MNEVLFSHNSDEWETPQDLFDKLNDEFSFDFDAAATGENMKCINYCSDSLGQPWYEPATFLANHLRIWLNPPYSKIGPFIKKAYEESLKGATVVCLIPSRTDTKWWHEYVMKADEIRFIKGRLKFGQSKNSAPFPSCIVVFKHYKAGGPSDWDGPRISSLSNKP